MSEKIILNPYALSGLRVIPIEWLRDGEIGVSPAFYKELSGLTPEEALAKTAERTRNAASANLTLEGIQKEWNRANNPPPECTGLDGDINECPACTTQDVTEGEKK
jgi:hypothetical protein